MHTEEITIQQQNSDIAIFMGYERYEDDDGIWFKKEGLITCMHPKLQELNYHSSWNQLMPVVEKIEQGNIGFKMCRKVVEIYYDDSKEQILRVKEKSRRESLYKAVVAFIKLLNGQNISL